MRARGQGFLTVAVVAVVALLAISFDRLGSKAPAAATLGDVPSGAWLCPHGGGTDWEATLYLANPGDAEVSARVTSMGVERTRRSQTVSVPPGGQVGVPAAAADRGSATYVEYFGGWISAGWVARGASGESGIGAEPCASKAERSWYSAGVSMSEGEQSYLVVMNPFASDAVFDVALFFAPPRDPGRDSELTDVTLDPGRSIAIRLNAYGEGESAVGVGMVVSSGRVAASTTVISEGLGIVSVLASPRTERTVYLPTIPGAGQSVLALSAPSDGSSDVGAVLLSAGQTRPVPNLAAAVLEPTSAAIFPVTTDAPSSIDVSVQEGDPIVAALRTKGPGKDSAATAGTAEAATAWVVPPTVSGEPAKPGVLVVNPGATQITVSVRLLPSDGGASSETTLSVPPASVASVPDEFLAAQPDASVMVTSQAGPVIVMGASTSSGVEGESVFGLAVGVPIPEPQG